MRIYVHDHHHTCRHTPSDVSLLISKEKQGHTRENVPPSDASFVRRQRKKGMTQGLVRRLMEATNPEGKMQTQYHRAYHCGSVVEQRDGKLTTTYCKTRCCLVCNGIRTAMLIDAYTPVVEGWADPTLVTLTVPNPPLSELRATVDDMQRVFSLVLKSIRRAGIDVECIRTIEVTASTAESVHPHFHVLSSSERVGRAILDGWLTRYPKAVRSAQDIRRADTGSLKELFKYVTKLTDPKMPATLLDGILQAMWGKHLVRPYGFRLDKDPMEDEAFDELVPTNAAFKRVSETILWVWVDEVGNWVDHMTGDVLVDGVPSFADSGFA